MFSCFYKSSYGEINSSYNQLYAVLDKVKKLVAIDHYERAIVILSHSINTNNQFDNAELQQLYHKRSKVFLAQGNIALALIDCEQAIALGKLLENELEHTQSFDTEASFQKNLSLSLKSYHQQLMLMKLENSIQLPISIPEDIQKDFAALREQILKRDGQEGIIHLRLEAKIIANFKESWMGARLRSKAYLYWYDFPAATDLANQAFTTIFQEYNKLKDSLSKDQQQQWNKKLENLFKYLNSLELAINKDTLTPMPLLITSIGFHSKSIRGLPIHTNEPDAVRNTMMME